MFTSSPARWLASLSTVVALTAGAQTGTAPTSSSSTEPPSLSYRSPMEGYKSFVEEKPIPWKEANDTVHQRGGWRAYAKEAAGDAEDKPSGAANPHTGHSMPAANPPKERP